MAERRLLDRVMTDIDAAEARERYRTGASTTQLAERFGVSVATINRLLPADTKRARGWTAKDVDTADIVRLREEEHMTWKQIGAAVDIHFTAARKRYLKYLAACRAQNEELPG